MRSVEWKFAKTVKTHDRSFSKKMRDWLIPNPAKLRKFVYVLLISALALSYVVGSLLTFEVLSKKEVS